MAAGIDAPGIPPGCPDPDPPPFSPYTGWMYQGVRTVTGTDYHVWNWVCDGIVTSEECTEAIP